MLLIAHYATVPILLHVCEGFSLEHAFVEADERELASESAEAFYRNAPYGYHVFDANSGVK